MKKVVADEKAGMIAKPGLTTISQVIATTTRTFATTSPAAEEEEEEVEILAVDNASFS
jgi:hypothetical protein